jgi:hypothetical protein
MKFSFRATIYKVGINPCVKVPKAITNKMFPVKGYIPVTGKINKHPFRQTLCPVKGEAFRLYVNGPMLKGGNVAVGDAARFTLQQNFKPRPEKNASMPKQLKKALTESDLTADFNSLTASRKKDILKYLNALKAEETIDLNISKIIGQLKKLRDNPDKKKIVRIP